MVPGDLVTCTEYMYSQPFPLYLMSNPHSLSIPPGIQKAFALLANQLRPFLFCFAVPTVTPYP